MVLLWHIVTYSQQARHKRIRALTQDLECWQTPRNLAAWLDKRGSHIYAMINPWTSEMYVGMIHDRKPTDRWQEHNREIWRKSEIKYRIMMARGGPESWFMIPLVEFGSTRDVTLVRRVERRMITKVPNNLNNLRRATQVPNKLRKVKAIRQKRTQKQSKQHTNRTDLNRFGTWVEAINLQGEHTTLQETAKSQSPAVVNTDSPTIKATIIRSFRKSLVTWSRVEWLTGNSEARLFGLAETTSLRAAMRASGWIFLQVKKRIYSPPSEDKLYQEMQRRIRHGTKHWYVISTMTELWRMYGKLGRVQVDADRKRAKLHILAALRKKGLTVSP